MNDIDKLQAKLPYQLIRTGIPGVYTSPAPPDDFDPMTATRTDLVKHGFLWRRPGAAEEPTVRRAWERFFSRKWLAKDRIVPQFEPHPGKTHILKAAAKKAAAGPSYTSNAWAGAVFVVGQWSGNYGTWTIPTVSKPSEPQGTEGGWNSSSWVGIDGFNVEGVVASNDVLQAGIEQRVNAKGQATYSAWYEWYAPAQAGSPPYIYEVGIPNFPVSPGQQVSCSVQYVDNNTAGYIWFANETTRQYFSITLAPPPGATFKGNTAEWIMEAPDGGEPTSSIPAFKPVVFTPAVACGAANAQGNHPAGNPQNADAVNIGTAAGKILTSVTLGNDTVTIDFIG